MVCHSRAFNFVLGTTELQMNKDHDYGNGIVDNLGNIFLNGLINYGNTAATATNGGGAALKDPGEYLVIVVNGVEKKIPVFDV